MITIRTKEGKQLLADDGHLLLTQRKDHNTFHINNKLIAIPAVRPKRGETVIVNETPFLISGVYESETLYHARGIEILKPLVKMRVGYFEKASHENLHSLLRVDLLNEDETFRASVFIRGLTAKDKDVFFLADEENQEDLQMLLFNMLSMEIDRILNQISIFQGITHKETEEETELINQFIDNSVEKILHT